MGIVGGSVTLERGQHRQCCVRAGECLGVARGGGHLERQRGVTLARGHITSQPVGARPPCEQQCPVSVRPLCFIGLLVGLQRPVEVAPEVVDACYAPRQSGGQLARLDRGPLEQPSAVSQSPFT